jgi:hypothetical protein
MLCRVSVVNGNQIVAVKKLHVRNLKAEQVDSFCSSSHAIDTTRALNAYGSSILILRPHSAPCRLCLMCHLCVVQAKRLP